MKVFQEPKAKRFLWRLFFLTIIGAFVSTLFIKKVTGGYFFVLAIVTVGVLFVIHAYIFNFEMKLGGFSLSTEQKRLRLFFLIGHLLAWAVVIGF